MLEKRQWTRISAAVPSPKISHNAIRRSVCRSERLPESILRDTGVIVKIQEFAAVIIVLIQDQDAVRRASRRDLAVLEGILTVILDSVVAELQHRDRQEGRNP